MGEVDTLLAELAKPEQTPQRSEVDDLLASLNAPNQEQRAAASWRGVDASQPPVTFGPVQTQAQPSATAQVEPGQGWDNPTFQAPAPMEPTKPIDKAAFATTIQNYILANPGMTPAQAFSKWQADQAALPKPHGLSLTGEVAGAVGQHIMSIPRTAIDRLGQLADVIPNLAGMPSQPKSTTGLSGQVLPPPEQLEGVPGEVPSDSLLGKIAGMAVSNGMTLAEFALLPEVAALRKVGVAGRMLESAYKMALVTAAHGGGVKETGKSALMGAAIPIAPGTPVMKAAQVGGLFAAEPAMQGDIPGTVGGLVLGFLPIIQKLRPKQRAALAESKPSRSAVQAIVGDIPEARTAEGRTALVEAAKAPESAPAPKVSRIATQPGVPPQAPERPPQGIRQVQGTEVPAVAPKPADVQAAQRIQAPKTRAELAKEVSSARDAYERMGGVTSAMMVKKTGRQARRAAGGKAMSPAREAAIQRMIDADSALAQYDAQAKSGEAAQSIVQTPASITNAGAGEMPAVPPQTNNPS